MFLGGKRTWQPQNLYNRINGQLGWLIGGRLLAVGCSLSAVRFRLSASGCRLSAICFSPLHSFHHFTLFTTSLFSPLHSFHHFTLFTTSLFSPFSKCIFATFG
jgi:hypothetical protein